MKTYTLTLTEAERDMLRDFFACYWEEYTSKVVRNAVAKLFTESLYNKIDNLDPEEVEAS